MPIHLDDLDVLAETEGLSSALIVPCNMCPAITVAVNQDQPFMELHRSLLTSAPFARHVEALQSRLRERGVQADVFTSRLYHHWFMCMWTRGRREKLRKRAENYDAVIVLGCDTANETVRESVRPTRCKVIEGMAVTGYMNAKLRFRAPATVSFEDCRVIPMRHHRPESGTAPPDR